VAGGRTREVTLDPGASADIPVRRQGPGGSLPGPDAGHPLKGAGDHCPLRRIPLTIPWHCTEHGTAQSDRAEQAVGHRRNSVHPRLMQRWLPPRLRSTRWIRTGWLSCGLIGWSTSATPGLPRETRPIQAVDLSSCQRADGSAVQQQSAATRPTYI
jgi:hypothetical protein